MGILTYKGESFYLDGEPFVVISGAIHYFRVPRAYWHDRLLKLKECGFNTVETYTCWNLHEPREGEFDFSGNLDIEAFIKEAQALGLYVILRPGPYICAEWELGGLPAWLLTYQDLQLRCDDELYLSKVRRYYNELLPRMRPYLAVNGGPIFMLQVENEYGSYADDKDYLRKVAEIYRENEMDCLYFTSDGPTDTMLTGGTLDEYLCVANFGSRPKERLGILKEFRPNQPLMCGEYWCGWFDHWYEGHHIRPQQEIIDDFRNFMDMKASINVYMFHGGTNFGFMNGANYIDKYAPTITSYDYNSPLTEAGDRTENYYILRGIIEDTFGKLPPMTAKETEKKAYGDVKMTESAMLFDNLDRLSTPTFSRYPKMMEDLGQNYGYILYRSELQGPRCDWELELDTVHDRAQVFVDGEPKAVYQRWDTPRCANPVKLPLAKGEKATMDILVENMGRVNYGHKLRDKKGVQGIRFWRQLHLGWSMYPLDMEDLSALAFGPLDEKIATHPSFVRGTLEIEGTPADTFIRLDGFKKGFVKINGINIGRYFNEAGPQKTLYVPAPFLKTGKNEILVFDSDGICDPVVTFVDTPDLGEMENIYK